MSANTDDYSSEIFDEIGDYINAHISQNTWDKINQEERDERDEHFDGYND